MESLPSSSFFLSSGVVKTLHSIVIPPGRWQWDVEGVRLGLEKGESVSEEVVVYQVCSNFDLQIGMFSNQN